MGEPDSGNVGGAEVVGYAYGPSRFYDVHRASTPEAATNAVLDIIPEGDPHPWNKEYVSGMPMVSDRFGVDCWRVQVIYTLRVGIAHEDGSGKGPPND